MADKLKTLTIGNVSRHVDLYKAGTNVTFSEVDADGKIAINANIDTSDFATQEDLAGKQDTLTPGVNIQIADGVISATDTTYTAGANITISDSNVISTNATVSLLAVDELPTTGEENVIYLVPNEGEAPNAKDEYIYVSGAWEKIGNTEVDLSNYYTSTQVDNLLNGKQDALTAGDHITITNGEISATYSKSDILTLLGYEEINMAMTDDTGVTNTWTILAKIAE